MGTSRSSRSCRGGSGRDAQGPRGEQEAAATRAQHLASRGTGLSAELIPLIDLRAADGADQPFLELPVLVEQTSDAVNVSNGQLLAQGVGQIPHSFERLHRPSSPRPFSASLEGTLACRQRQAESVLEEQRTAVQNGSAVKTLERMRDLAYALRKQLSVGDVDCVGSLLHENWEFKKRLVGTISSSEIDQWYELGRQAGATGGKVLGAGGGGFLLLFADPERHDPIRLALRELREVPMKLAARGTHISVFTDALE